MSRRRKTALAARRHGADQDAKTHDMERHIRMVTDAVTCKLRGRQTTATAGFVRSRDFRDYPA